MTRVCNGGHTGDRETEKFNGTNLVKHGQKTHPCLGFWVLIFEAPVAVMALDPSSWTTADVGKWLSEVGFADLGPLFLKHDIDGEVLLQITEDDLKRKPLKLEKLGDCKKLSQQIASLKAVEKVKFRSC